MFIRLVSLFNSPRIGLMLFTVSWTVCIFEYVLLAILFSKKLIKLVIMQKTDTKDKIHEFKKHYHSQNDMSSAKNSKNQQKNKTNNNIHKFLETPRGHVLSNDESKTTTHGDGSSREHSVELVQENQC